MTRPTCRHVRCHLDAILDGHPAGLDRTLEIDHLRTCDACAREHRRFVKLRQLLSGTPPRTAPVGFVDGVNARLARRRVRRFRSVRDGGHGGRTDVLRIGSVQAALVLIGAIACDLCIDLVTGTDDPAVERGSVHAVPPPAMVVQHAPPARTITDSPIPAAERAGESDDEDATRTEPGAHEEPHDPSSQTAPTAAAEIERSR